jgi:50S ribosomal protein L16 3-hydroxylase
VAIAELKFDKEAFLSQYWQRKPLLIRHGLVDFSTPLPADELAGLAMEEGVESRIIEQCDGRWLQRHGPFVESDFQSKNPWTLLVQAVDHYIPAVAQLRQLVNFLPQWRVDDVMGSYAVDGGSVGPHYDNYDVFLLQGEGERRWQLGEHCNADTPLLPHDELRILRDFNCTQEYVLSPGDILYLPPGIAHYGTAIGECTTFSIGFRAPRLNDMVSRWVDRLLEQMDSGLHYSDSNIEPVTRAGEIRTRDLDRVRAQVQAALDEEIDSQWFGELVTEPRYDHIHDDDDLAEARELLRSGSCFVALSPAARVAWQHEATGVRVFANGESRVFAQSVLDSLTALCESWRMEEEDLARCMALPDSADMLDYLLETGGIYVE